MAGRKKSKFFNSVFEKVQVSDFAAEGKAICRIDNMVVFVNHAAPGDIVDIKITKAKRNYLEGTIIKMHEKSLIREVPFCEHFGICGGCKWQHISYEKQIEFKQQQVVDSIERIAKILRTEFTLIPVAGSENPQFYRNKLEYTFTNKRWLSTEEISSGKELTDKRALGFHVPGFFDKVMDIRKCYLQPDPSDRIRLWLKDYSLKNNLTFYDLKEHKGWLRNIIIRNNLKGNFMVNLIITNENEKALPLILDSILVEFPEITSLFYTVNQKRNSSITDLQPVLYRGVAFLEEQMEDIKFKIGPKSFYQTNSKQAYSLYSIAREFAELQGSETVYDLYTGAGTIACFIASKAKKVIGIEYVEEAIQHAKENAANNGINNAGFYCGDMAHILTKEFIQETGKPDVIITDPPRAGMHPKVIEQINKSGAKKIVYVSCNPATQARDINMMSEFYNLEKIRAVDMFPHTQHVESVALLSLK